MTLDPLPLILEEGLAVGLVPSRGLLGLAETALLVRRDARLIAERGRTMTTLAATLSVQDRPAMVTTREPNGVEWTLSVGAVEAARP